ncbi:MAG: TIGR02594 family protein [Pseudomonadota bacterium]|jgi:uncharacterized protein (TIGR02594 family)|nr:TIGR02594 family protein [Pseudomonadota bacterium]
MTRRSKNVVQQIQHELARRGFDPGIIDGIWGRRTERSVRAFQERNNLLVDGIVGPKTWQALLGTDAIDVAWNNPGIPWFQEARRLIGVKERVGPGNEPEIIGWAKASGISYDDDDIPWCGLLVAHCISSTLRDEPLPNNPLGARNWLKFGAPSDPSLGTILVFWREKEYGWKGHVGFYAGEDKSGAFHVLGGNQSNCVSIARIKRDRLLGARWPASAPFSGRKIVLSSGKSMFSTSEA